MTKEKGKLMEYEWEKDVDVDEISMPDCMHVVGLVVWNAETGEGALIKLDTPDLQRIECADVWKDAMGDAQKIYNQSVDGIFPEFQAKPVH